MSQYTSVACPKYTQRRATCVYEYIHECSRTHFKEIELTQRMCENDIHIIEFVTKLGIIII